ncbi:MAG: rod shape-determining protein RodA [Elusimicrobiota bacterium]|nr:rod shape-determining protein RodA [Elusimicrobiota bacterium]
MSPYRPASSGQASRVDWTFVFAVSGLLTLGSLSMLSAASTTSFYHAILQKHFVAMALGLFLFSLMLAFNYQVFQDQSKFLYALAVIVVVATLVLGKISRGQRSWIHLGGFAFQPAELARTLVILALGDFLDRRWRRAADPSTVFWALAIAAPVMALILKQPDLSTTLTFVPAITAMLYCAGASLFILALVFGYGALTMSVPLIYTILQVRYPGAAAGSWPDVILSTSRLGLSTLAAVGLFAGASALAWRVATWMRLQVKPHVFIFVPLILSGALLSGIAVHKQLKGYQRNRFVAWVAPHTDSQGAAYNVIQSQIAVGSGGLLGKGLFSGTQSQLGFLPERHTDFVFANVGEETGFVGSAAIVGLYMLLLWRIVTAARLARDRFGYLVCVGLAAMLTFQLALNVGMCLGLMPVAGVPLPLVSYGGSSLMITLWSLGIVANIYARRYALL